MGRILPLERKNLQNSQSFEFSEKNIQNLSLRRESQAYEGAFVEVAHKVLLGYDNLEKQEREKDGSDEEEKRI
ncbi:MAG TPA: hypothetical protein VGK99_09575 [Acidobacteriota bacterium]|jgi:hypothetical protein